jgi:hypothetical protein
MTSKLPTDPLADASTGVVRRSRGAFLKTRPTRPDRRERSRQSSGYTGPERRKEESKPAEEEPEPKLVLGQPRWLVIAAAVYVAVLALSLALVFTY